MAPKITARKGVKEAPIGCVIARHERSLIITLEQLDEALGISFQQLHKHEKGRGMSLWRAVQICQTLDVPLSELIPRAFDQELARLPANSPPGQG